MTTMLRYVKYLKKLHCVNWKVALNHQIKIAGNRHTISKNTIGANLIRSYATVTATKPTVVIYGNNNKFQVLHDLLNRSGRVGVADINEALNDIQLKNTISPLDALLLIRSCGRPLIECESKESIQLVQEIWDTVQNLKVSMDVSHYNALLNVYIEKDHDFSSDEFLKMMTLNNIEPNRVTYQRLIRNKCRMGDIAGATETLEIMKQKDMPICENIFNSLILGHSMTNDMENAENILKVMESTSILPSENTYAELMCAYAKRGDVDSINKTLEKLRKLDIAIIDNHYLDIVYELVINGHMNQAEEFLKKLPHEIYSDTEVSRLLIKLTYAKLIDFAIKILTSSTTDPERRKVRSISITRVLSKCGLPVNEVIRICLYLTNEIHLTRAFNMVLYHYLQSNPNPNDVIPLFKAWAETGAEIRNHYFWPLLVHEGKSGNIEGVKNVLTYMMNDFNIQPSFETVRDYVIPYTFGFWQDIINTLEPLSIPKDTLYSAIASRLLIERKLGHCARFVTSHPAKFPIDFFLQPLVASLNVRYGFKSFVTILRYLCEDSEELNVDKTSITVVDAGLKQVMQVVPSYRSSVMSQLLSEMVNSGLSISSEVGQEVKEYLGDNLKEEDNDNISKLISGSLTEVPINEYYRQSTEELHPLKITVNSGKISELRSKFNDYMSQNDEQQVLATVRQLSTYGFLSAPVVAQALNMFCDSQNLEAAKECIKMLNDKLPDSLLDYKKICKYAHLLISKGHFSEAIEFLTVQRPAEGSEKMARSLVMNTRALLDLVADNKDVTKLEELFNLLKSKNYIEMDNNSLGPCVKIHLLRNDTMKAFEVFEHACKEYTCTPFKNILAATLIAAEDVNLLQRWTDLCTEVHGENNALVDLALIFLECGKIRQAKKIFETPGLAVSTIKISNAIDHFVKYNQVQCLDQLHIVTVNTDRIDRTHLYNNLLNFYNSGNNWKAGLGLWTSMQEDDIQPTQYFLQMLQDLLQRNNQKLPFTCSDNTLSKIDNMTESSRGSKRKFERDEFDKILIEKKYDIAEEMLKSENMWTRELHISKHQHFINVLLSHGELDRAVKITKLMISTFDSIKVRPFNNLCNKLIKHGRNDDIKSFREILSNELQMKLNYYKLLNSTEVEEKGLKYYLDNFESNFGDITDPNVVLKHIPCSKIVDNLIKDPSCSDQCEEWAKKLWDKDVTNAINAIWNYYFIINHPREQEIYDKYISNKTTITVKPIIRSAKSRRDIALLEKLKNKVSKSPAIHSQCQSEVYVALTNMYTDLERYDEAIDYFNHLYTYGKALKVAKSVLFKLKTAFEIRGKKFPVKLREQRELNQKNDVQYYSDNNNLEAARA